MTGGLASQGGLAVLSLGAVLLLVLGAARAARALPALRLQGAARGAVLLHGSLALDRGRRLHLVEAAGCQVLVLTGGTADAMLNLPHHP